ncbi:MAG: O-antigen ligase family protein [Ramlibacter sp.]
MAQLGSWETLRPWPVYMLAAFIPLSLAATNVAKLLALLACAVVLCGAIRRRQPDPALKRLLSVPAALLMLAALALSLAWTTEPGAQALSHVLKYSKLLLIPAIVLLIRTPRQAALAVGIYVASQAFVVATSWLLYLGAPVFWVPADRNSIATVYSSYLDQTIMTAGFAAICWHLRREFPGRRGAWVGAALAAAALVNALVMLPGRSGHVAAIGVMSLALLWAVPARWRLAALAAPVVLAALAMAVAPQFNERLTNTFDEISAYQYRNDPGTSSGQRLTFWHRSLQAMAERPLSGFGAGSWNREYTRQEITHRGHVLEGTAEVRNPHQEYLLWGVHLGVGGMALLVAWMALLVRDAQPFVTHRRRATVSVVAVMAIACLFNSSLFDALIGEYFCIVIGLMLALGLQPSAPVQPAPVTASGALPTSAA